VGNSAVSRIDVWGLQDPETMIDLGNGRQVQSTYPIWLDESMDARDYIHYYLSLGDIYFPNNKREALRWALNRSKTDREAYDTCFQGKKLNLELAKAEHFFWAAHRTATVDDGWFSYQSGNKYIDQFTTQMITIGYTIYKIIPTDNPFRTPPSRDEIAFGELGTMYGVDIHE